jgi:predicted ATPase
MIERIRFKNFKALKDAELKLGPFNLIVGPNGSGKSSVLQGFEFLANPNQYAHRQLLTVGCESQAWSIDVRTSGMGTEEWIGTVLQNGTQKPRLFSGGIEKPVSGPALEKVFSELRSSRIYALEPSKMTHPVNSHQVKELERDGSNLGGALTYIRDQDEDAYDHLRSELQRWLPEFDAISFDNDQNQQRKLLLRQSGSKKKIPASELSEGTLLALALLAIAYQPNVPTLIGVEEPDRALHPRLLREVRDALYRLAFPTDYGLKRKPVQVIATTHSPYFLDLFRDHAEQVIVAEKKSDGTATFRSLSDDPNLHEIIGDAPLGEVWYSGVLGGVPVAK